MGLICGCTQRKDQKAIVFVGPKGSGKSSLIYYLKHKQTLRNCVSTTRIENNLIQYDGTLYEVHDSPHYYPQIKADAWVFVLDITQPQEIPQLNDFLRELDNSLPVLIFLNKIDLVGMSFDFNANQIE